MTETNRRNFLMGSLAAAGMARDTALAASPGDGVTAGFIGVGNRGSYLLKLAMDLPGIQVGGLCDIKPDRLDKAATAAARFKPKTYRDYHRLLDNKDINTVFIATPCDLHVEMAVAALEAGKNVYCEKPLGISPESILELVKAVRRSKMVFQVGQQMRSYSRLKQTVQQIHDGVVGDVIMVKAQRHSGWDLAHDAMSKDWFFNASRSGDVITEMSVHNLDVCNWIIGSLPARAAGFGGTLLWKNDPPGRTNMDGYTLSYDYRNGVKMSYTQVFFHPRGMPGGGQYFYVYGAKGAVDVINSTFYPLEKHGGTPRELVPKLQEDPHAHIKAFLNSIRTGAKPPADINIGATGALTAILGRKAIYQKKVKEWREFGVQLWFASV